MKARTNCFLTFALAGFAGLAAASLIWAQTSGHKTGRIPLTITYEHISPNGSVANEIHYYRSDGSYAHALLMPGSTQQPPQIGVFDLRKKLSFLKDPVTQLVDEMPLTQRIYDQHRKVPTSCQSLAPQGSHTCEPLGTDRVLGYRVQKATVTVANRPGMTMESWVAPDLDFVPLLVVRKDGGESVPIRRAIDIQLGEPDESVFSLPPGYRRVANASEFVGKGEVARGRQDPFTDESRQKFDDIQSRKRAEPLQVR